MEFPPLQHEDFRIWIFLHLQPTKTSEFGRGGRGLRGGWDEKRLDGDWKGAWAACHWVLLNGGDTLVPTFVITLPYHLFASLRHCALGFGCRSVSVLAKMDCCMYVV
jgi:hypothetical protein